MSNPTDLSLDPADFETFRSDAHRLLDACLDHLAAARNRPWQPVDAAAHAGLAPALPQTGIGESQLARELAERVLPFGTGNTHPRFFGWVHGTGLAAGLLADITAAAVSAALSAEPPARASQIDHQPLHISTSEVAYMGTVCAIKSSDLDPLNETHTSG